MGADLYELELELIERTSGPVAGVDEVGRGPLAGPVVAAAVVLPAARIEGLADSKVLDAGDRERLFREIIAARAEVGVGWSTTRQVDRMNILQATHRAMARAIGRLPNAPVHLLVDGHPVPGLPGDQTALVKGDARCACISAASIVAKVVRDRFMDRLARTYPQYGFDRNKGYGTAEHCEALETEGPCPHHRRTFSPVAFSNQGKLF
ncbi:MAG: ribonuclease HII [Gemmatimonadota bacterium]|nr:MAG: ribonuclease HII [Gemmatimonadota bacterium]